MAAPIGPGDLVRCVDDQPDPGTIWFPEDAIVAGAIYRVSACFVSVIGRPAVSLVGRDRSRTAQHRGGPVGYRPARFVPIHQGPGASIEEIKRQLETPPLLTPEDA